MDRHEVKADRIDCVSEHSGWLRSCLSLIKTSFDVLLPFKMTLPLHRVQTGGNVRAQNDSIHGEEDKGTC